MIFTQHNGINFMYTLFHTSITCRTILIPKNDADFEKLVCGFDWGRHIIRLSETNHRKKKRKKT